MISKFFTASLIIVLSFLVGCVETITVTGTVEPIDPTQFAVAKVWDIGDGFFSEAACDGESCAITRIDLESKTTLQVVDHNGNTMAFDGILPNSGFGASNLTAKANDGYILTSSAINGQGFQVQYLTSLRPDGSVIQSVEQSTKISAIAKSVPDTKYVHSAAMPDGTQLICFASMRDNGDPNGSFCTFPASTPFPSFTMTTGLAIVGTAMATGVTQGWFDENTGETFYQLSLLIQNGLNTYQIPFTVETESVVIQPRVKNVFAINNGFQVLWSTSNDEEHFLTTIPATGGQGITRVISNMLTGLTVNNNLFVATEQVDGHHVGVHLLTEDLQEITTTIIPRQGDFLIVSPNVSSVSEGRVIVTWTEGFITVEDGESFSDPETWFVRGALVDLPTELPAQ